MGINHYSTQFLNIFPISYKTVISAISCSVIYVVALLFTWGILPVMLPLYNIKRLDNSNRRMFIFILVNICVLIIEIVISIVLTEEGNVIAPAKICYRYFQIFEVPLIVLFINNIKKFCISRLWGVYVGVLGVMFIYFLYIDGRQCHAIIDAPLFLLMDNITKFIIPNFNLLVCVLTAIVLIVVYFWSKQKKSDLLKIFTRFSTIFVMIFFAINLFQLPYYTNTVANGGKIQNDSIVIADYLESNGIKDVYFVESEQNRYEGAVYAYLKCPFKHISINDIKDIKQDGAVILMSADSKIENSQDVENIDIGTETLKLLRLRN